MSLASEELFGHESSSDVTHARRARRRAGASHESARDVREHDEDDEEGARGGRHCDRAAQNSMTSASPRLANDIN